MTRHYSSKVSDTYFRTPTCDTDRAIFFKIITSKKGKLYTVGKLFLCSFIYINYSIKFELVIELQNFKNCRILAILDTFDNVILL